jgi:hypothetical protein
MKAEASGALAALQDAVELERSQMTLGGGPRGTRAKARPPPPPHLPGFPSISSAAFTCLLFLIMMFTVRSCSVRWPGMHPAPQYDEDDDEDASYVTVVVTCPSCPRP